MHLWGDGMSLGLDYKNGEHIFDEVCGEVPFLTYPLFEKTGVVKSAFSTRIGGVSKGCYESMNLSFDRGDDKDAVMENFQRIASAIGTNCHDMVLSRQTHTANVRVVTEEDKGKGIVRERDYTDVDGLVTNVPGICLVTSYADCVPLYFVDPIKKVIGLSHSGWRGTVGKIGKETVRVMKEHFGCDPADILAAVGPSICQDCYEVSGDVIEKFKEAFDEKDWDNLFYRKTMENISLIYGKQTNRFFGNRESARNILRSRMSVRIAIARSYIHIGRQVISGEICARFLH